MGGEGRLRRNSWGKRRKKLLSKLVDIVRLLYEDSLQEVGQDGSESGILLHVLSMGLLQFFLGMNTQEINFCKCNCGIQQTRKRQLFEKGTVPT